MAWFGDVPFKQLAVIESLMAEKESETNIHNLLPRFPPLWSPQRCPPWAKVWR